MCRNRVDDWHLVRVYRKETNTRQQFRTIGTSTVVGALIGIMLGTRSVWDPGAPRPENDTSPTTLPEAMLPPRVFRNLLQVGYLPRIKNR